jgi:hypothetical protein
MSRRPRTPRREHKAFNEAGGGSAPLVRLSKTAKKHRQQAGGRWGVGSIGGTLGRMGYENGGTRSADFGAIRVLMDASQDEDPRVTWAAIEESLPADLETEYASACSRDLRHFKGCVECSRGNLCDKGLDLAAIRSLVLDAIAIRNRGYGLAQTPSVQVPGSAYGNFR